MKGLDLSLFDMCVGERRKIEIPARLAYGRKGSKVFGIPPDDGTVRASMTIDNENENGIRMGMRERQAERLTGTEGGGHGGQRQRGGGDGIGVYYIPGRAKGR